MFQQLLSYCNGLVKGFSTITPDRTSLLAKIADYINLKRSSAEEVKLIFICTHNSRRSHFGQVWAAVAAHYYGVKMSSSFSGGTEATAVHPNTVAALRRAGFDVTRTNDLSNPVYKVRFDESAEDLICFSKTYDHPANPQQGFAAIMTCSEAGENCPFIPGAELRIATTYEDPKLYDDSPLRDQMYDERCRQIAREMMYVFSLVN